MPNKLLKSCNIPEVALRMTTPMMELANRTIAKMNMSPNCSMASIPRRTKSGAKAYSTREPSSGGIGSILNMKNPRFTWTNNDHFTHSVELDGQPDRQIKPGESVEITFDTPGKYDYKCTLHPHDMSGTVIVK